MKNSTSPRFFILALAIPITLYASYASPGSGRPIAASVTASRAQANQWDFGDAPAPYPSLLSANGARHIDTSSEWLGTQTAAGSPATACVNSTTAEADAKVGDLDNDDGLVGWWFNPVTGTLFATLAVSTGTPSGTRYLNALTDLNQDGDWSYPQEWSVRNFPLDLPPNTCNFLVSVTLGSRPPPLPATGFSTWVRFTLTRTPIPGTTSNPWVGTGEFASGETEDYHLQWAPSDNPGPGGVSPPRFEFLDFTLKCSPDNKTILHGDTQNFVLTTSGNIKPNNLKVVAAGCTGCDPDAVWVPQPLVVFSAAPGVDILSLPPVVPGLFPPSLISKDLHPCTPASVCTSDIQAWYFNADPARGQVGAAASLATCKCSVAHEPPAAPAGTGTLKSTVTDQDGNPIAGAIVEVIRQGITIARGVTNDGGKSKVKRLAPGPAVVESFFDVFYEFPDRKPVDIMADAVAKAKLVLQRPAEIIGRVIGKDKSGVDLPPPRFFDVFVIDPANPQVVFVGGVTRDGDFRSGPISPGTYVVRAAAEGFKKDEKQVTLKAGEALRVDLNPIKNDEPDFNLSVDPNSLTIQRGGSGMSAVTVQSLNGFNKQVSLDCLPAPAGVNCGFNPAMVTPPSNGTSGSVLTVNVSADALEGPRTLEVKGSADGVTRSRTISLNVTPQPPPPDFNLSAAPFTLTIQQGDFGTSTVTVQSINGFDGLVGVSCESAPAGVGCAFDPNPVRPTPSTPRMSTLTINVAPDAAPGTYVFNLKGNGVATDGAATTHTTSLQLTVTARGR